MPWRILGGYRSQHLRDATSPNWTSSSLHLRRHLLAGTTQQTRDSAVSSLIDKNYRWARSIEHSEPTFFEQTAKVQSPKVLWIGCSDSRVPESVITASKPGEIFVHRNIANQFRLDDDSALSALTFAIENLGVEHVVVVGHTQCGGAAACFEAAKRRNQPAPNQPPLNRWLAPLTDMAVALDIAHTDPERALPILVEANVRKQVENVCMAPPIRSAWSAGGTRQRVWVHGLLYEVENGTLKDLGVTRGPPRDDAIGALGART